MQHQNVKIYGTSGWLAKKAGFCQNKNKVNEVIQSLWKLGIIVNYVFIYVIVHICQENGLIAGPAATNEQVNYDGSKLQW